MTPGSSIFLIGPMGSGKSAVGRRLAKELGREFFDSDDVIEKRSGVDIPFIFEREGEAGFRQRECKIIDELTQLPGIVLATGGGAAQHEDNRMALHSRGFVVYLHATIDQQLRRIRRGHERPMLKDGNPREILSRLMAVRDPQYREIAHMVVATDGCKIPAVVREIRRNITAC
ncbi:MAG: shikimate kinase AroK [Gammaproteobacteria bacterium]|nr:shikimate kinase AroK [Gammaproteobacteria bacterium]MDH5277257.1 shikimate kinase AroK [Gammaproteobacteria bacterium]